MGIDFQKPEPLYRQIAADIKREIVSGKLKSGHKLPSHHELTKKYNVSLITIKKALSELINERTLFSRPGKGIYVASPESEVDTSKYPVIGFVLQNLTDPFFALIADNIENTASQNKIHLLLSTTTGCPSKENIQIKFFRQIGANGLIIASSNYVHKATEKIRKIHREDFPYVMISYVKDEDIYYVGTDHEYGAFLATEHLLKLGYKEIAYISGQQGDVLSDLRKNGYLRALKEHDRPVNNDFIIQSRDAKIIWNSYEVGHKIGSIFPSMKNKPEAFFAYDDYCAIGFQRAVLDQGFKIPDDIAIVGFDDIELKIHAPVPLTTIHQSSKEIAELAFEIIKKRINGEPAQVRSILRPILIIRESCGAS